MIPIMGFMKSIAEFKKFNFRGSDYLYLFIRINAQHFMNPF